MGEEEMLETLREAGLLDADIELLLTELEKGLDYEYEYEYEEEEEEAEKRGGPGRRRRPASKRFSRPRKNVLQDLADLLGLPSGGRFGVWATYSKKPGGPRPAGPLKKHKRKRPLYKKPRPAYRKPKPQPQSHPDYVEPPQHDDENLNYKAPVEEAEDEYGSPVAPVEHYASPYDSYTIPEEPEETYQT